MAGIWPVESQVKQHVSSCNELYIVTAATWLHVAHSSRWHDQLNLAGPGSAACCLSLKNTCMSCTYNTYRRPAARLCYMYMCSLGTDQDGEQIYTFVSLSHMILRLQGDQLAKKHHISDPNRPEVGSSSDLFFLVSQSRAASGAFTYWIFRSTSLITCLAFLVRILAFVLLAKPCVYHEAKHYQVNHRNRC